MHTVLVRLPTCNGWVMYIVVQAAFWWLSITTLLLSQIFQVSHTTGRQLERGTLYFSSLKSACLFLKCIESVRLFASPFIALIRPT